MCEVGTSFTIVIYIRILINTNILTIRSSTVLMMNSGRGTVAGRLKGSRLGGVAAKTPARKYIRDMGDEKGSDMYNALLQPDE